MAHLHARDELGQPTFDPDVMEYIVRRVRAGCDALVQVSTGNLPGEPAESLPAFLGSRPEFASFNLKDEPDKARERAEIFRRLGVRPVIEAFDVSMIRMAGEFLMEGQLPAPLIFELVFELEAAERGPIDTTADVLDRVRAVEEIGDAFWSVTRGAAHRGLTHALALGLGGWIRVGMEDSLVSLDGSVVRSSAELVDEALTLVRALGRRPARYAEARTLLRL